MTDLYLTAYDGKILGPIAKVLGWCMDKIYVFLSNICHIESIALTIVIFTIFIYLVLFPLTYKQQKFSVLTRKMQPEMNAIRDKYKGKKDQASMQAMNNETQALYDKYGISPTGNCIYLVIQMPILFALYRVFYNVPAYISSVKNIFTELVTDIVGVDNFAKTMADIHEEFKLRSVPVNFESNSISSLSNNVIDVLYKLPLAGWDSLKKAFPNFETSIDSVITKLNHVNSIFALNISDTPLNQIKFGFTTRAYDLIILALLVPILAYVTQMLNIKLTPTVPTEGNDSVASSMKTMNIMMPLMSFVICFSTPVGLGIYWIAGAVIRSVQQAFLNYHFEKINLEQIIENNKDKAAKKAEKRGIRQSQIYEAAKMNTKNNSLSSKANFDIDEEEILKKAEERRAKAAPGSLSAKANLVKEFNERNNK